MTGVVEQTGRTWTWTAWHVAAPVTAKHQAAVLAAGTRPEVRPRVIAGAEGVVALIETTIVESKPLGGTVSDRKDVVLYGSEASERYVGGAKVKAQLATWGLSFKVRDGATHVTCLFAVSPACTTRSSRPTPCADRCWRSGDRVRAPRMPAGSC
jgi:hypothetical protein